ncbi:hypothetical protein [Gracilimonas sp.]|uniref:hypothetical protein n=1 Tax=Gracilimonas sp. TaxID=1974203 RepID=UPI003D0D697E
MNTDFDVDKSKEEFTTTNINLFIMLKMKISALTTLFVLVIGIESAYTQGFWEPVTNVTGYISTEFNYFDDLDGYEVNYGAAVSEAGMLVTYRPTSNFSIKSVFVYRPGYDFDLMLNEAFGELKTSDAVKIKVGRFLTPLSPMNTYYYAPVNTSATLPIIITNNENFPLNIDGISLNGSLGESFKLKYDVFGGGYTNSTWKPSGAISFFGQEVPYYKAQINSQFTIGESYNGSYNVGVGGKVSVAYESYVEVGAGFFNPKKETMPIAITLPQNALGAGSPAMNITSPTGIKRPTWGYNAKLKYGNTEVNAEYWTGDIQLDAIAYDFTGGAGSPTVLQAESEVELEGRFIQLSHRIDKFIPYARYEFQHTSDAKYKRYSAGINYKPSFTRTVKLEYVHYEHKSGNINGLVAALIYSF